MRFGLSFFLPNLAAVAASLLTANIGPAVAQSDRDISASHVYTYARYYAPYAIQAKAAYLPVNELDDRHGKVDTDGYGTDVNYVVQSVYSDQTIQKRAREAFKYWRYQFGSNCAVTDVACQDALRPQGWWPFGGGPTFQVWARSRFPSSGHEACTEVSIAFRGTVGGAADWFSNFDRFGSPLDDYYHQLRRNIDYIVSTIRKLDCFKRARFRPPQIVSTGHSLGGGLAQFAALANRPNGPRIAKVFAFDPSPVTGAHLIEKPLLAQNSAGLTIDRIYEQGEILSYARGVGQEYPSAKSACNPLVRTVDVEAFKGNLLDLHSMTSLSAQMVQLSYDGETPLAYAAPPPSPNCKVRYRTPGPEQTGQLVADSGRRQTLVASVREHRRGVRQFADRSPSNVRQSVSTVSRTPRTVLVSRRSAKEFVPGDRAAASSGVIARAENESAFSPSPQ